MAAPEENRSLFGRVLRTAAIVGVIAVVLLWLTMPHICPPTVREEVSRARADMLSLAMAVEAYFVETMSYPAFAIGATSVNGVLGEKDPAFSLPTFPLPEPLPPARPDQTWPVRHRLLYMTLTTPNAYITAYPKDPFSTKRKATFVYWCVMTKYGGRHRISGQIGSLTIGVFARHVRAYFAACLSTAWA